MARTKNTRITGAVLVNSETKTILAENPPHYREYRNGWYVAVGHDVYSISSMGVNGGRHVWDTTRKGSSMAAVIDQVISMMNDTPATTSACILHRVRTCLAEIATYFPSVKVEAAALEAAEIAQMFKSGAEAALDALPRGKAFPFYRAYLRAHMCSNIFLGQTRTVASISGEVGLLSTVVRLFDGEAPKDTWSSMQMFPYLMTRKVNALWTSCGFKTTAEDKQRHGYAHLMSKILVLCVYEFSLCVANLDITRRPCAAHASPADKVCAPVVPWAPRKEKIQDIGDGVYPPRALDFDTPPEPASPGTPPGTPECICVAEPAAPAKPSVWDGFPTVSRTRGVIRCAASAAEHHNAKRAKKAE